MKKITAALLAGIMTLSLLAGCEFTDQLAERAADMKAITTEMRKSQEVQVIREEDKTVIATLNTQEEISQLFEEMNLAVNWKLVQNPKSETVSYRCVLSQDDTQRFGEDKSDVEQSEIMEMVFYQDVPYITLILGNVSLHFQMDKNIDPFFESLES
ncbi:hypothetical protein [Massiliimalia timonensis]|uniref:Lipoprotein n=1 Tax=Massiliimalia timonensis TaxID=1987501 RepID=A0A8J6TU28_9FIRM|nr:hypothetical protein [Massiliimalia timonensis]MBC8610303.1 hypothetical protein [Massiliimalia timonensis]MBS7175730.1 hypothetical protein [Clostridiales bacterium]